MLIDTLLFPVFRWLYEQVRGRWLVLLFRLDGPTNYKALTEFLNQKQTPFRLKYGRISRFCGIKVDDDIYGYEVTLFNGAMLDCNPAAYGLDRDQAHELYHAILSCVAGSVLHQEKMKVAR